MTSSSAPAPSGFDTIPLPLALHLASYTVVGLFCMFAGLLNLIDPGHILRLGLPLLALTGFSWGYVFGILMERKEVVVLGFLASGAYIGAGIWKFGSSQPFGLLLMAIGAYGLVALALYRKQLLG
jgi:hypothetical protein